MKPYAAILILLLLVLLDSTGNSYAFSSNLQLIDTVHNNSSAKEVLTSQQLFVVEVSDIKKNTKNETVEFKAELRDAFKVICFHQDNTHTVLEWTMITNENNPKRGLYLQNTSEYKQLNRIIVNSRKQFVKADVKY